MVNEHLSFSYKDHNAAAITAPGGAGRKTKGKFSKTQMVRIDSWNFSKFLLKFSLKLLKLSIKFPKFLQTLKKFSQITIINLI